MFRLFLLFTYAYAQICQLRLILNDAGNDGWEDNYITGTTNGASIVFTPLDSTVSAANGKATLLQKNIGSFSFQVSSGSSIKLSYQGVQSQYSSENSWVVELYDIINPFGAVILSKSTFSLNGGSLTPYADPIQSVVCGPKPAPVSSVIVSSNSNQPYLSTITWVKDVTHDSSVLFAVSFVRSDDSGTVVYLGITDQTTFNVIFPSGAKVTVTVEALNKYGPSLSVSSSQYKAPTYTIGRLFLRLYDSEGFGWGVNDGAVAITLNDYPLFTATFECPNGFGCYSKDLPLDVPAGVNWRLKTKFIAPTKGREDCSYRLYRQDGAVLFETGQNSNGPISPDGDVTVHFDDGCPTADPWSDCIPTVGVCGNGAQTRHSYKSVGNNCQPQTETQPCSLPCPVNCVGQWGDWSGCSPNCGVGYKTRNYTVLSPSSNNGAHCPFANGQKETRQCLDSPPCPQICSYVLDLFDSEQDGWGQSYLLVFNNGDSTPPLNVTLPSTSDDDFDASRKRIHFTSPRGTNVVLKWYPVNDGTHDPREAAWSVSPLIGDIVLSDIRRHKDVLQSPPGLNLSLAPPAEASFVASCVDCGSATLDYCNSLHRDQCEFDQTADNTCGSCSDGYQTSSDQANAPCTDVDECLGINRCLLKKAKCQNVPGSYICYCNDPSIPVTTDVCPSQTSQSFLEMGTFAKQVTNLPPNTANCPGIITRKEWSEMTSAEQTAWIAAVQAMFNVNILEDIAGGKSALMNFWQWTRQLHYIVSTTTGQLVHGNSYFLPWHRSLLDDVEGYVRTQVGSCLFLPFYDSSRVITAGSGAYTNLFNNGLFCNPGTQTKAYYPNKDTTCSLKNIASCNPTFDTYSLCNGTGSQLWRQKQPDGNVASPSNFYSALMQSNWDSFTAALENYHGYAHVWVGGWMGALETAGGDPIFFSHHAFIDSIWSDWQACSGLATPNASNPKVWSTTGNLGFNSPMPRAHGRAPVNVYSVLDLGYRYSYEFLNTLHNSGSGAGYCYSDTGATSSWFDGIQTSTPSIVLPAWILLQPPQVSSPLWVYDYGDGWLYVNTANPYWAPYPSSYQTFQLTSSLLESQSNTHLSQPPSAPTPQSAPYTPYQGFYKKPNRDTKTSDIYSSHGSRKKHKKPRADFQAQEASNWKKLRRAFKDEYARSQNMQSALEAMSLIECSLVPHTQEMLFSPENIKGMHREKLCAAGLCHDPCYRLTHGKNAKRRAKRYLKKHGGQFPVGYTSSSNATNTPSQNVFAESSPHNHSPMRIQHRSRQSILNP